MLCSWAPEQLNVQFVELWILVVLDDKLDDGRSRQACQINFL